MRNQRFVNRRQVARDIFSDEKPTQQIARDVLPILILQAQKAQEAQDCNIITITMRELAKEVIPDKPKFNFTLKWAFTWIHNTLYKLERQDDWNYGEIPGITAIVLDKPKKPTKWMAEHTSVDPSTPLPWKEYKTIHIKPVFQYSHWDKVVEYVTCKLKEIGL